MTLESMLMSVPVENWRSAQVIAFDYYDGAREGVCVLAEPRCDFYFELLDERWVENDLDDRLFRLSTLPAGLADRLAAAWKFDSVEDRERARRLMHEVQAARCGTPIVIYTRDLEHFLGCWRLDPTAEAATDWFARFGVVPSVAS